MKKAMFESYEQIQLFETDSTLQYIKLQLKEKEKKKEKEDSSYNFLELMQRNEIF